MARKLGGLERFRTEARRIGEVLAWNLGGLERCGGEGTGERGGGGVMVDMFLFVVCVHACVCIYNYSSIVCLICCRCCVDCCR